MRDPNRIPEILKELEKVWSKYPDLRLGQLIINLSYVKRRNSGLNRENVIYYEEDEDFLEFLKSFEEFK